MGRKTFTIGEIAQILDIPASTLRFWEGKRTATAAIPQRI